MRIVVQRVVEANVCVDGASIGSIKTGLLVLLGIHKDDEQKHASWLINKLISLRIFSDNQGKMNLSLKEVNGQVLVVSQFTLYGNCKSGKRPDFFEAAPPKKANELYQFFIKELRNLDVEVSTGSFGANMQVSLINDGPVTLVIDSKTS